MRPSQAFAKHRDAVCSDARRYHVSNPRVYVRTPKDLPPSFRAQVLAEARPV